MNVNNPYSDLKILHHFDALKSYTNGERFAPVYIRIKPTNVCNQRCFYCCYADDQAVKNRKVDRRDFIPREKMCEILEDIKNMGVKAVTFSGGGDPLCYPYIEECFEKILSADIDLSIITNGQMLTDKKAELLKEAKWVRISLDSANRKTYEMIRNVKTFDEVISNTEAFAKIKNETCELGINFVVNEKNYLQIYDICKLASSIGVNNIKFSGIMIQEGTQEYHSEIRKSVCELVNKAKSEFESNKFKIIDKYEENLSFDRKYDECCIQQFVTIIAADQKVYRCYQKAYTLSGCLGSIEDCSFKELWFSDETANKFKNFSPKNDCKAACVYDQRNILLNDIKNLDRNHINFI